MALRSSRSTSLRRRGAGRTTRGRRARTGRAPGTPRTTGLVGTTDQEPASSSTSREKDYVSYVYVEDGTYDDLGDKATINSKQALGAKVQDASTLKTLGSTTSTGASIGSLAGSAIPIPGVGSAIGSVTGGAVGAIVGGVKSIFGGGGGPKEVKFRGVLPILLKQALAKKGARAVYHWDRKLSGDGYKDGVKVEGKAFKPENMLRLTKELARLATKANSNTQGMGGTEKYIKRLDVTNRKPREEDRIIASFQRPRPTSEVTANSTTTEKNGTPTVLYLLGAGIPLAYFLTR